MKKVLLVAVIIVSAIFFTSCTDTADELLEISQIDNEIETAAKSRIGKKELGGDQDDDE